MCVGAAARCPPWRSWCRVRCRRSTPAWRGWLGGARRGAPRTDSPPGGRPTRPPSAWLCRPREWRPSIFHFLTCEDKMCGGHDSILLKQNKMQSHKHITTIHSGCHFQLSRDLNYHRYPSAEQNIYLNQISTCYPMKTGTDKLPPVFIVTTCPCHLNLTILKKRLFYFESLMNQPKNIKDITKKEAYMLQ